MEAGQLRHTLIIKRLKSTQDRAGQPVQSDDAWHVLYQKVPARIVQVGGNETFDAPSMSAVKTTTFGIRSRADIREEDRCHVMSGRMKGRVFNVVSVTENDNESRELYLTCREQR